MKELKIDGFDHLDDKAFAASPHQEEINTLKIDKLSNRVTIISIIIPCIIGAIIIFGYLGMQETVIDVNNQKQNKIIEITDQFAEKTNALDVKFTKIKTLLDKSLPKITKQIKQLDASIAMLSSKKVDKTKFDNDLKKINKINLQYKDLANQIKKINNSNNTLIADLKTKLYADIAKTNTKLDKATKMMDEYETLIATTSKNLSILEKRYDEFNKGSINKSQLNSELVKINKAFASRLKNLENKLLKKINSSVKTAVKSHKSNKPSNEQPIEEEIILE